MDIQQLEKELFNNIDKLPTGCQYCIKGEKLVLFITGLCDENCYYCPISENRKNKDLMWANEKLVNSIEEIIEEAKLCSSKGIGITGGSPLLKINKVCKYIKILKKEFGDDFHIHLYTSVNYVKKDILKKLQNAGLDELRLHFTNLDKITKRQINKVKIATEYINEVGIELPAIPNNEDKIINLLNKLKEEKIPINFLNLNELEYSETNYNNLIEKGFVEKNQYNSQIKGSEETALKVIEYCKNNKYNKHDKYDKNGDLNEEYTLIYKLDSNNNNINVIKSSPEIKKFKKIKFKVHYCPSALKDGIQMKNRLINRASNVAKSYEMITEEGLILKGVISFKSVEDVEDILKILNKENIVYEIINNKVLLNPEILEEIIFQLKEKNYCFNFSAYVSEYYPTSDKLEVEVIPLCTKKRSLKDFRKG